jgi:Stage II sporulation protein E (SpoIIE)
MGAWAESRSRLGIPMLRRPRRHLWFTVFVVVGMLLALVLLGQTVWTYVFVSRELVRREARRHAARDVTALERAIFAARIQDPDPLRGALGDLQRDASTRIAWVNLVLMDAKTLVGSAADQQTLFTPAELRRTAFARDEPSRVLWRSDREILVFVFPLRLPPPPPQSLSDDASTTAAPTRPMPPRRGLRRMGPVLAEIGIYRAAVSAQFGGLQQASVVNVLAACALMAALVAMALRFPAYVRGRETDAQLLLARRVQQDLLPTLMPVLRHAEVNAICVPASDVGGDLFDLVSLDDDEFAFLLGDVSGKGAPAALLMAVVHGAFHGGELWATGGDLSRWMNRLNTLLMQRSSENRFVTLFCATFNARTATLTYVNGGHPPPLLFRAGEPSAEPDRLETGGPVVGILPDATYEEGRTVVRQGDVILLYSDGVTEATNLSGAEFGTSRLSVVAAAEIGGSFNLVCNKILEVVRTFTGRTEPEDDQTVMVVRFTRQRERRQDVT